MPPADLLRLAELALSGHVSPQLAEEILRAVVEDSNSRAGVLRRGEEVRASWPRSVSRQVEDATGGWTEIPFGDDRSLAAAPDGAGARPVGAGCRPRRVGRSSCRTSSRGSTSVPLWESRRSADRQRHRHSRGGSAGAADQPPGCPAESAAVYLGSDPSSAEVVGSFGPLTLAADELERAWGQGIYTDALLALPLQATSGTLGVLVAANKEARAGTEPFAGNDIRVMELFAVQVTMAMEFARLTRASLERERLKRELEVAAEIQSHLHPLAYPEFAGYRLAARSSPSRQVAGDTYDVLVNDHRLVAIVADVSGKGVGAGLLAAGIHASVRLLSDTEESLAGVASRINATSSARPRTTASSPSPWSGWRPTGGSWRSTPDTARS
jgi:hypothetical protein